LSPRALKSYRLPQLTNTPADNPVGCEALRERRIHAAVPLWGLLGYRNRVPLARRQAEKRKAALVSKKSILVWCVRVLPLARG